MDPYIAAAVAIGVGGLVAFVATLARRGMPDDGVAAFASYAWMIAKHESKSGSRVYNQFNPANPLKELPNKTNGPNSWGWGIGQIDRGTNGCVTAVVYDWHRNVSEINAVLRTKRSTHNRIVGYFRSLYANDTTTAWCEPENASTNVNGITVSGEMWSVLTLYNGGGGCPTIPLDGLQQPTPLVFDPVVSNWVFHTNRNDYVSRVTSDSGATGTE